MQKLQKLIDRIRLPASLEWIRQFLKFTIMGTVSTAIELSVYYLCLKLFSWNYQASNAVSVFISTVNAYIWSHMFVFGNGEKLSFLKHMVRFLKTSATYGITFLLGIVLLWTAVEKLSVSEEAAKIFVIAVQIPINYVIIKFWAFGKKQGTQEE